MIVENITRQKNNRHSKPLKLAQNQGCKNEFIRNNLELFSIFIFYETWNKPFGYFKDLSRRKQENLYKKSINFLSIQNCWDLD